MMEKSEILTAATLGLALAACASTPAGSSDTPTPTSGSEREVRCWGVNATKDTAKCAVTEDDIAAVQALLGADFDARYANTQTHGCGKHAACGTQDGILNWTSATETACHDQGGILVEDNPEDSAVMRVARDA